MLSVNGFYNAGKKLSATGTAHIAHKRKLAVLAAI